MIKKVVLVIGASIALTACAMNSTTEAETKLESNVTTYGDVGKRRFTPVRVIEHTDSEGCKFIIASTDTGIEIKEKSNSPCRKGDEVGKTDGN